jgi:nickel transport protein
MKYWIITLLLATAAVHAHDLWIDDAQQLYYGHADTATSHGDDKQITDESIAWRQCIGAHDNNTSCDLLMVALKPVYYTKTPYGTKHESKDKLKQVVSSKQVFSFAKRIYNPTVSQALNRGFEITLRESAAKAHTGDKLRLHIAMDGTPLEGAPVAYGDRFIGVSDKEGNINVKIRHGGLQQIKATYEKKGDGIHTDTLLYETHLNLRIVE